jgi:hypothetical protein
MSPWLDELIARSTPTGGGKRISPSPRADGSRSKSPHEWCSEVSDDRLAAATPAVRCVDMLRTRGSSWDTRTWKDAAVVDQALRLSIQWMDARAGKPANEPEAVFPADSVWHSH